MRNNNLEIRIADTSCLAWDQAEPGPRLLLSPAIIIIFSLMTKRPGRGWYDSDSFLVTWARLLETGLR